MVSGFESRRARTAAAIAGTAAAAAAFVGLRIDGFLRFRGAIPEGPGVPPYGFREFMVPVVVEGAFFVGVALLGLSLSGRRLGRLAPVASLAVLSVVTGFVQSDRVDVLGSWPVAYMSPRLGQLGAYLADLVLLAAPAALAAWARDARDEPPVRVRATSAVAAACCATLAVMLFVASGILDGTAATPLQASAFFWTLFAWGAMLRPRRRDAWLFAVVPLLVGGFGHYLADWTVIGSSVAVPAGDLVTAYGALVGAAALGAAINPLSRALRRSHRPSAVAAG